MGVTIFVALAGIISLISWVLIIPGGIFIILYFRKRSSQTIQKKRGFILPLIAITLGEIFLFPVGWLAIILSCNLKYSDIFLKIVCALSILMLIVGIVMLTICAVKAMHNRKVKTKTLLMSVIFFLIGFLTTGAGISFIMALSMSSK